METLFLGTQPMIKATVNLLSEGKLQRKNRSRACDITQLGEASCSVVPRLNNKYKNLKHLESNMSGFIPVSFKGVNYL